MYMDHHDSTHSVNRRLNKRLFIIIIIERQISLRLVIFSGYYDILSRQLETGLNLYFIT
jgi:hypothetical protein